MIKIFSFLVKPKTNIFKWIIIIFVITIATLGAMGYLDQVIAWLDSDTLTFKLGKKTEISVYRIIKSIFIIVSMFWVTGIISDYGDKQIRNLKNIKSSNRAIISKSFQIVLYFIAFLILMDFLEIDLKTLTIFSGAVGIGVGFGLQKIASNFISGLILLFEKSSRVDDIIELDGGIYGYLRHTGARYTVVEALDGREIVIPNEDFITSRVTNWTYNNKKARVEIPIGVAYDSDLKIVKEIMIKAAKAHPKCIKDPAPQCYLRKFGESSVDFVLFFWVADVTDGRFEPQSDVMFGIWEAFKANNIKIPYPQREVYIRS